MSRLPLLLAACLALTSAAACTPYGAPRGAIFTSSRGWVFHSSIAPEPLWLAEPRREEVIYVHTGPVATPPTPPRSRLDRLPPDDDPPPFDAVAARGALARIDVSVCRTAGAPPGYGHAKVSFNPSGEATKVVIDEPNGLPATAVKCIGDRLGAARVPAFRGSYVTVGTTWLVR